MEIYDFEIRRWTKEFDNIRKVLQTSANFVRWYTPTKRILNLLPPVRDGYFLCTFILKFKHRGKPTFFLGYYKKDAPTMEFQITDIDIDKGNEKMGAPIDKDVIIIKFK